MKETEKKKNNNQIFAMTIGVPGSGKSTYLKKIRNFKVISRDVVRFAILDKYTFHMKLKYGQSS